MPIVYDYNREEQEIDDAIGVAGEELSGPPVLAIALGLGAAFLLYRKFMQRKLREELAKNPKYGTSAEAIGELVIRISSVYMGKWKPTLAVNLALGYAAGLQQVRHSNPQWTQAAAAQYADSLGDNINAVSMQAMMEGVQSQINRGVPARVAIDRAIDAFGVAPKSMKSLVNIWTRTPATATTAGKVPNRIIDAADSKIAQAITERAKLIGDSEARLTMNASKAMFWAYQAENGDIPAAAEKEWITARDERTCPVCAPLNRQRVLVTEKFESSIGPILAPGVHPRCRCSLKLHLNLHLSDIGDRENMSISKSRGADAYDRDRSGQFAATESRAASRPQDRFKQYEVEADDHGRLMLNPVLQHGGLEIGGHQYNGLQTALELDAPAEDEEDEKATEALARKKIMKLKIRKQKHLKLRKQMTLQMAEQTELMLQEAGEDESDEVSYRELVHHLVFKNGTTVSLDPAEFHSREEFDAAVELASHNHAANADAEFYKLSVKLAHDLKTTADKAPDDVRDNHSSNFITAHMRDGSWAAFDTDELTDIAHKVFQGNLSTRNYDTFSSKGSVVNPTERYDARDVINALGDAGEEFMAAIVAMRPVVVVAPAGSAFSKPDFSLDKTPESVTDRILVKGINEHYEEMEENPFLKKRHVNADGAHHTTDWRDTNFVSLD